MLIPGLGSISLLLHDARALPPIIISISIALIFLADRTTFWLKEHKHFDPWTFAFLCFLSFAIGLATVKRRETDAGFLNRDQTDEWKGWMQSKLPIQTPSDISTALLTQLGESHHTYLSLSTRIASFWNLQPNQNVSRIIPFHDWLWPYDILSTEGRFRFTSHSAGQFSLPNDHHILLYSF